MNTNNKSCHYEQRQNKNRLDMKL